MVIAIVAILIAILVPAVQKVRAAAARTQCANNLRQIGIACHSHHDVLKRLPPGGANDQPPFGTMPAPGSPSNWGSSWMVYILPYVEQAVMYEQWQFSGNSGYANANNNALATGVDFSIYSCPSSALPHFKGTRQSRAVAFLGNYVGISGAIDGVIPGFTEGRINNLPGGGMISGGGVMIPNGQLTMTQITDGTSNTIMFSEQCNFVMDNTGKGQDWRATQPWGWYLGVKHWGVPPNFLATGADNRAPGMATIRYQIGYAPAGGWANDITNTGVGIGSYTGDCTGANIPLSSSHSGGANVLFADGTVRSLASTTSLVVLAQLATRDDGVPVTVP